MKKILFITLLFCALCAGDVFAAQRNWTGGTGNWNTAGNWSGSAVPGVNDTVYIDAGDTCTMDVNGTCKRLEISGGKLVQSTFTLTIGTSGAVLSGGTFTGGSGTITLTGAFTLSGCAFTSTSGTFTTNSNFTFSGGTFTHNSGKVRFTATSTISVTAPGSNIDLYQLEFAPATTSTYTIASGTTLTVMNTLTVSASGAATLNTGNIHAKGNLLFSNTSNGGGGTATITINGAGTQTFTGNATEADGQTPDIVINKVSTDTLKLMNIISSDGDWTWTSGIIDAGTSTVYFIGSHTVSGTHALYNVTKTSGTTWTINSGDTLIANGTFKVVNANIMTINGGVLRANGNIDVSTYTFGSGGGTATIYIAGTGNQTFTGTPSATHGRLPNIKINKSGGTLTLVNYIFCAGDWTYTDGMAGTIDAGSSTVQFRVAGCNVTGTHTLNNVVFHGDAAITYTISGTLTVAGTLSFNGSNTLTVNGDTIHAKGNITTTNTNTSTGGNATIVINGTGDQILTGSGTAGAGKLPNITIDKPSDTLAMVSVISVTGHWIYTTGTVVATGSTVAFYGSFNVDGQQSGTSATMAFNNVTCNANTRTLTGNLNVDGHFTIASGATCVAGANTIYVGGNWNSAGTWTYGTSTVVFDGTTHTTIAGAAGTINFANVTVNRSYALGTTPKSVRLLNPVQINTAMTLAKGRIITDTLRYLAFIDNATCTVTNDDSAYVCGPVRKTGDDVFTFPLGDTLLHDSIAYHPLAITAPSVNTDRFEAQYYAVGQTLGSTLVDTLASISDCEYWRIEKQAGSSNVYVKVYWNRNSCGTDNYDDMRLAGWNGTQWQDLGVSEFAPGTPTGSLRTAGPMAFSSQAVWAVVIGQKPNYSPYAILKKQLDAGYYQCSNGKLMFRFDGEYNDPNGKLAFRIYNDQYGRVTSDQLISSGNVPNVYYGSNYYLLNVMDCDVVPNGNVLNGFYILEIINEKNERWYLRFKHTTPFTPNCTGDGGETE